MSGVLFILDKFKSQSYLSCIFNFSMWGGPSNPKGGYLFPTHYFDGSAIHDGDFSDRHYPNNKTSSIWYPYTLEMYSEEEYFSMVPPSMSCSSILLPANDDVFRNTGTGETGANSRPVVCKGTSYYMSETPTKRMHIFKMKIDLNLKHDILVLNLIYRKTVLARICFR